MKTSRDRAKRKSDYKKNKRRRLAQEHAQTEDKPDKTENTSLLVATVTDAVTGTSTAKKSATDGSGESVSTSQEKLTEIASEVNTNTTAAIADNTNMNTSIKNANTSASTTNTNRSGSAPTPIHGAWIGEVGDLESRPDPSQVILPAYIPKEPPKEHRGLRCAKCFCLLVRDQDFEFKNGQLWIDPKVVSSKKWEGFKLKGGKVFCQNMHPIGVTYNSTWTDRTIALPVLKVHKTTYVENFCTKQVEEKLSDDDGESES